MSDDSQIPLLQDLLYKGQAESNSKMEIQQTLDEHCDMEIESFELASTANTEQNQESTTVDNTHIEPLPDEISDTPTQESDEKIRLILERHMDQAYQEIKRLLDNSKN